MERRTFLTMLPASLLAASHAAEAQQGKHVIGVLNLGFADSQRSSWDAFRQGLRERGYIEGDSVAIEFRSADGEADRLPALIAELLALKVKVIVTAGTTSVQAAKSATSTTPIVIAAGADPVAMNFAQSLARPGANITGLSILAGEIAQKRLELLRRAVPHAKVAAFLLQSANPGNAIFVKATTEAGQSLGLRVQVLQVRTPDELEQAFAAMVTVKADALLVVEDPIFLAHAKKIADLALRHRLPTMLGNRLYVHAGGLMAYGLAYDDLWRRAAGYVDRILKGAKPAEMPIEQPNKFDLIINLKTAKALGLTIPRTLLLQADQVVE
jgi:putative ABC transport system substrate-binding protein